MNTDIKRDNMISDQTIAAFRQGDERAFSQVHQFLAKKVTSFAYRFVGTEDAHEIVSQAFVVIWKKKETFDTFLQLQNYLYKVVTNGCIDFQRRQTVAQQRLRAYIAHHPEIKADVDLQITPERERKAIREQVYARLDELVSQFPEAYQVIYDLSYRNKMTDREVAVEIGRTEKSVSHIKSNIRSKLIDRLREYLANSSPNSAFSLYLLAFLLT